MKKILMIISSIVVVSSALVSCNSDEEETTWNTYRDWRETNDAWLAEQQARTNDDGTPYFQTVVAEWNPAAYVLIHYFNDRSETEGNLSPLYTSTVDVKYIGQRCDGTVFDSSESSLTPSPGVFRIALNRVISGWDIALCNMRVADTAEVIVPYAQAYGSTGSVSTTDTIKPYSNLKFNLRLVDIYHYEIP